MSRRKENSKNQDNFTSLQPYLQDIALDLQNHFMLSNEDSMHTGDKVRLFEEITTETITTYYIAILVFNRNRLYLDNYISFLRQMTEETADDFLLHFVLVADKETYNAIIEPLPQGQQDMDTETYNAIIEPLPQGQQDMDMETYDYQRFLYKNPVLDKKIIYAKNVIVDMYTTSLLNLRGVDLLKGIGAKRAFINKLFSDNFSDTEFQIMVLDDNITGICNLEKSGLTPRTYHNDKTGVNDIPVLNVALQLFADSAKDKNCMVRGIIKGQGIGETDIISESKTLCSRALYKMSVQKVNRLKEKGIYYSIYFTRCLEDLLFLAQIFALPDCHLVLDTRYKMRFGHYTKGDNEDNFQVNRKSYEPSPPVKGIEMPYLFCIEYMNTMNPKIVSSCYFQYSTIPIINLFSGEKFISKYAKYHIAIITMYFFVFLGKGGDLCKNVFDVKISNFIAIADNPVIIENFKKAYNLMDRQQRINSIKKLGIFIQENNIERFKKELIKIISSVLTNEETKRLFSRNRYFPISPSHTLNEIKTAAIKVIDKLRNKFTYNPKKTAKTSKPAKITANTAKKTAKKLI